MKRFLLNLALLGAVLLPGCITVASRDSSTYQPQVPHVACKLPSIASYSLSYFGDKSYNPESLWGLSDTAEDLLRERLRESKLFSGVYKCKPEQASNFHLHFDIEQYYDWSPASAACMLFSLNMLPNMEYISLNASVSVIINGQQVDSYHAVWTSRFIRCWPLILAAPFCNDREAVMNEVVDELLEQLKSNSR